METDQGEGEDESMTGTMTRSIYDDDEPVTWQPANTAGNRVLELSTHCKYPALPDDVARDGFTVMVHVRAPALSAAEARHALLDVVTVLDVSEIMSGAKLAQVKSIVRFLIDSLGPHDRLSVVAFSGDTRRVTRLTCMTEDGKATAKCAVEALKASGGSTNVRAGLDEAAKVLESSQHRNDIVGVIFISDGRGYTTSDSCVLLPEFLLRDNGWRSTPVHTFRLSSDVDAADMHNITEVTGGTFSFVEDHAVVQDTLA
ncbi:unnamed protein product [Miscanthus lutarioriparius]|uniref:VWFA domain-containing protein n=1 Tax=Miscanthus lutarioriparius TaxID=422564 RepID=A0A811R8Y1_9POAL|nr:unnamed protein product [Miscanthus lutarioriparius]